MTSDLHGQGPFYPWDLTDPLHTWNDTPGDYPQGEAPLTSAPRPNEPPTTEGPLTRGWCCPVCSGCYAPWVAECYRCNDALAHTTDRDTLITWVRRYPATTVIKW